MPVAVLDQPVVVAAEQHPVGQGGGSAGRPWPDVVGFAPARRPVAAGEGAAAVAQDERPAQRSGEQPPGPADVEDLAAAAEHRRDDGGVAGEPAGGAGGDRGAVVEGRAAQAVAQDGQRDGDHDLRPVAAGLRQRPAGERRAGRPRPARRPGAGRPVAGRARPPRPAAGAASGSSAARTTAVPSGSSRPRSQAPPSPSGVKRQVHPPGGPLFGPRQRVALAGVGALGIGHARAAADPTGPAPPGRTCRRAPAGRAPRPAAAPGPSGNSATVRAIVTACPRPNPPAAPARAGLRQLAAQRPAGLHVCRRLGRRDPQPVPHPRLRARRAVLQQRLPGVGLPDQPQQQRLRLSHHRAGLRPPARPAARHRATRPEPPPPAAAATAPRPAHPPPGAGDPPARRSYRHASGHL